MFVVGGVAAKYFTRALLTYHNEYSTWPQTLLLPNWQKTEIYLDRPFFCRYLSRVEKGDFLIIVVKLLLGSEKPILHSACIVYNQTNESCDFGRL